MAKVSPLIRSFNGGEFSPLMEGRTDIERYNSSCRKMQDYIAAPQGPALPRSGSLFVNVAYDPSKKSVLVPFVYDQEDSNDVYMCEFADERVRFFTEEGGILVRADCAGTVIEISPIIITSPALTAQSGAVGQQIVLGGWPASYNLNGRVATITDKTGDDYTIDLIHPDMPLFASVTLNMVYHIDSPYTEDQLETLRNLQSLDVVYLFNKDMRPQKLLRRDTYDWEVVQVDFIDGPYLPINVTAVTLTCSGVSGSITVTASAITAINDGEGFKVTDIGRLIRIKHTAWGWLKITAWTSTTVVTATVMGANLAAATATVDWRMGYWSDTTGWPNCGTFYQDRFAVGGSDRYPDLAALSVQGEYEDFTQTDTTGTVLDDNAIAVRLNSRQSSRIKWMVGSDRGILMGTGSQEYVMSSAEGSGKDITPSSAKVVDSGTRGSTDTDVLSFGAQVLFVQRFGRQLREFAYVYDADGYKAPSMNLLSSHLGISPFVEMAYAAEPHSIVWVRRANGTLVGMTYNRDENVVGWHRHNLSDGFIESIAVIPSTDQLQDALWLVVRRTINGEEVRYIERLTRFWDFDMEIEDAHYVDCALRYSGDPIDTIYGLTHLEGHEEIYGLADNVPIGPFTVEDGSIELLQTASEVILGIGFDAECETSAIENGAQDGTAQGKVKRMNGISVNVWSSYGGEIGTYNEDKGEVEYTPLDYPRMLDEVETINLFSGIIGPVVPAPGYWKRGSIFFRRRKDCPLPFNVTSLMPQMNTQDR